MKTFDLTKKILDSGDRPHLVMLAHASVKIYAPANDNGRGKRK